MNTLSTVLPKDAIAIDGGAGSASFAIDRTYVEGAPYQWAVELLRNIIQVKERMIAAGDPAAEQVEARFDFIVAAIQDSTGGDQTETYKRCVWNTGAPMQPHELLNIYSKLNIGAGSNRWSKDNLTGSYGMGARAATLPFTDLMVTTVIPGDGAYAVVLGGVDVAAEDGTTSTIYTIKRGSVFHDDGVATLADPLVKLAPTDADFDGEVVYLQTPHGTEIELSTALVPDELLTSTVGGVSFLFLGKGDYKQPTEIDPTPRKIESPSSAPTMLTERFVGGFVPATFRYMYKSDSPTGPQIHGKRFTTDDGQELYADSRGLKPLSDWTDRAEKLDPVTVDPHGTTITAYLLPEDYWHTGSYTTAEKDAEIAAFVPTKGKKQSPVFEFRSDGTWGRVTEKDRWLPFGGKGQVIVKYGKHEMYPLKEGIKKSTEVLKQWGISEERVARSVLLVIEPPVQTSLHSDTWGITQNAARSSITGPNGSDLPLGEWKNVWLDNFPRKISDRLMVREPSTNKEIPSSEVKMLQNLVFGEEEKSTQTRETRTVIDPKGSQEGEQTDGTSRTSAGSGEGNGGGGPASKDSQNAEKKQGGKRRTTQRRQKLPEPPQPVFLNARQWDENGYDPDHLCVVSPLAGGYKIELNRGHRVINRQVKHFWDDLTNGYFAKPQQRKLRDRILRKFGGSSTAGADSKARSAALDEIEYVYRRDALATFLGAEALFLNAAGELDHTRFQEHICDEPVVMTTALAAHYPQEEAIKSRLGGLGA